QRPLLLPGTADEHGERAEREPPGGRNGRHHPEAGRNLVGDEPFVRGEAVKRCDDINSENKPRLVRQEGLNHFMDDNPSKKKKEAEASPIMMSPKDHPIGSCFPLPGSPPGGSAFPSAAGTDVPDGPR